MLIHGGPEAAWNDQWSTRFNPQVWAGQGYVYVTRSLSIRRWVLTRPDSVFIPNFTGSTGFGQAFVDAVAREWGGAPFEDMRAGWAHVLNAFPEIDPARAAAAGGSWGGYAIKY
jgi:dipeptidyl aminopeptidase/acylaminoacyl peptidase